DTIAGGDGDDIIVGGAGNDTLIGGAGNDRYLFAPGDGRDVIDNSHEGDGEVMGLLALGDSGEVDEIRMSGFHPDQLDLSRNADDLVVRVRSSTDQITVLNHFESAPNDRIVFGDGSFWGHEDIAMRLTNTLTEAVDIFYG